MPDDYKFWQLVLLLAARSVDDRRFGLTKLNKLLFFCDFLAFRAWGRSITGAMYQKRQFGPAPLALLRLLERMIDADACREVPRVLFGRDQRVIQAIEQPDLTAFTDDELALIDDVLAELRHSSGAEVSDLSHEFIGWQLAEYGEEIPYETVFVEPPRPLTPEEEHACRQAAAAG